MFDKHALRKKKMHFSFDKNKARQTQLYGKWAQPNHVG
jgi:hypothetical protein